MFTFQYNTNSMVVVEAVAFATSPLKHLLLLTVVSSVIALQLPSNDPLLSISTANLSRPIAEDDHHDFFDDLDVHFVSSHTSKEDCVRDGISQDLSASVLITINYWQRIRM
jgi:hypothetical protein